jgi:hypothetical protein
MWRVKAVHENADDEVVKDDAYEDETDARNVFENWSVTVLDSEGVPIQPEQRFTVHLLRDDTIVRTRTVKA